jgi:3-dehydroquinate synthase class II
MMCFIVLICRQDVTHALNSDFTKSADAELILELQVRGYDVDALLRQRKKRNATPAAKAKVIPISVATRR